MNYVAEVKNGFKGTAVRDFQILVAHHVPVTSPRFGVVLQDAIVQLTEEGPAACLIYGVSNVGVFEGVYVDKSDWEKMCGAIMDELRGVRTFNPSDSAMETHQICVVTEDDELHAIVLSVGPVRA
jgi:hypothetical protein